MRGGHKRRYYPQLVAKPPALISTSHIVYVGYSRCSSPRVALKMPVIASIRSKKVKKSTMIERSPVIKEEREWKDFAREIKAGLREIIKEIKKLWEDKKKIKR